VKLHTRGKVTLASGFGIGAPAAVCALEILNALGVKRAVTLGTAGTLSPKLDIGGILICEKAVRDEGTSHHYLEPAKYAFPGKELTEKLKKTLEEKGIKAGCAPVWTTDAPYRETVEEIQQYRREGVMAAEMEAAAVFCAAQRLGMQAAAAFVISDDLSQPEWRPCFGGKAVAQSMETLFNAVLDCLEGN
jgi:uridine phosphorylase